MIQFLYKIYYTVKYSKEKYPVSPFKVLKMLNESQYWPIEDIKKYHLKKLNEILLFSKKKSKFYNDRLKNVKLPLSKLEDLKNEIPILARDDIRTDFELIRTEESLTELKGTTSGSSGDPITVYTSKMNIAFRIASVLRFKKWWNIDLGDKSVLIWNFPENKNRGIISKVKKYLRRRIDIPVNDLNTKKISNIYNSIEKFKPVYIRGYKSGVLEFAELLDSNNLKFKKAKFKVAIVTSEILYEYERVFIESVLNCKVANEYGAVELGLYGYECPLGSMHVNEEASYIYTDNNAAIVTDFYNKAMPLINYKNKDRIIISNKICECGRTSRIIKEVIGRDSSFIIKPDGSKLNQVFFDHLFKKLDENVFKDSIKKFRVVQKGDNFDVFIVPGKNFNSSVENFIKDKMYSEIGNEIEINFILKDKIEREKSGKLRYFVREEI